MWFKMKHQIFYQARRSRRKCHQWSVHCLLFVKTVATWHGNKYHRYIYCQQRLKAWPVFKRMILQGKVHKYIMNSFIIFFKFFSLHSFRGTENNCLKYKKVYWLYNLHFMLCLQMSTVISMLSGLQPLLASKKRMRCNLNEGLIKQRQW